MAPRLGIAPSQTGLEAVVLLLHQRGMEGKMAGLVGFEPTISCSTGKRFRPLSYNPLGWTFGSAPNPRSSQDRVLLLHYKHQVYVLERLVLAVSFSTQVVN